MPLLTGDRLGPYEVVGTIGVGGMGEVYRARDERLGRDVAVKVLPAALSANADRLRRFETEARALGQLAHPNVLVIHDFGTHGGAPYVVSELLEGETLAGRLGAGALPLRKAVDIAVQICAGLAAAHEKGIVHRDLKPDNVFLTMDGRVKLLDFGLAKLLFEEGDGGDEGRTAPGVVMGTAGYMSPEQVRALPTDHRSDIFALGAILYEMLSGRRAFDGPSAVETMHAVAKEDPPPLGGGSRETMPAVELIVLRCLEKRPEDRFQSARDLGFALGATTTGSGPERKTSILGSVPRVRGAAPPGQRGLGLGLGALVLVAGAFAFGRLGRHDEPPEWRQVSFRRGRVVAARFAPDGQTILYSAAWEGRPPEPFSTRLDSPESRQLGLAGASLLGVSKGGEMLLSLGCRLDLFSSRGTLARAALGGGAARPLAEDVEWADISPDGARLAVVRAAGGRTRLEYPLGKVLHETAGWLSHARIAPDGRSVAFLDHPVPWDDRGAVAMVDEAGKKTVLAAGWDSEQGLAWSPRGDEVWFTAAPAGIQRALYAVSTAGRLRVVARIPGSLTLHDLAADGRVLLSRDDRRREMRGRGPDDAEERDLSWLDQSAAVDVSADGRQLLFLEYGGARGPNYAVYVRPLPEGPAVYLGDGNGQSLSPDGRSVLAMIHSTPPELRLLPTGTGEPRSVRLGVPMELSWAAFLPNSRRAVVEGTEAGKGMREYLVELDGGAVRAVTPEGTAGFAISADGTRILATGPDGAWALYPIAGGPPAPVPGMRAGDWPVRFARDDGTLYLFRRHELPARIERLDLRPSAGAPGRAVWRELVPADPAGVIGVSEVAMSPDGKAFAYSLNRMLSTLYVVRGLR